MGNIKRYAQKIQVINGGIEYSGGLTGDTLTINGKFIDNIVENSGDTNLSTSVYTEKAIKEYVEGRILSNNEIGELTDVDINNISDYQILSSTGGTWENNLNYSDSLDYNANSQSTLITENGLTNHLEDMNSVRNVFTGFENYDDSSYTINGRNVSIAPSSSSFNIFYNGKKIEIDTIKTLEISTDEGKHYIYFDSDGELQELVNPSDIEVIDLIQGSNYGVYAAFVYWNNSDSEAPYFAVERHGARRNNRYHIYQHITEGTRHESGALIGDYTLNEDSSTGNTISITPGYYWDEDQRFTYTDGTNNSDFVQEITPELIAPMIYKDGSIWTKYEKSENLFQTGGTGGVLYNDIDETTNSGSQVEITDTGYTFTYIAETNDPRNPLVLIQGQNIEKTTISEAENQALDNFANLQTQGLPFQEIKVIWIIIGYADTTLSNERNYTIAKVLDVRDNKYNILSGVGGVSTTTASSVSTDINSFDNILGGSDTNVQKALNTLDDNIYSQSYINDNFVNENGDTMTGKLTISSGGIEISGGIVSDTLLLDFGTEISGITTSFSSPGDNNTLATTESIVNYVGTVIGGAADGISGNVQFANENNEFTSDDNFNYDSGNTTLSVSNINLSENITGTTIFVNTVESPNINTENLSISNSSNINAIDEDDISTNDNFTIATTSAITTYVQNELDGFSSDLSGLTDTTISDPQDYNILQYIDGSWENVSDVRIEGSLTILNDLYISGTTTTVNTKDLNVTDRLILINSGETGSGVTNNLAGIEVERGTLTNYQFLFDEIDDIFKVGQVSDLQAVATREDNPNTDSLAYWNNSESRFDTDSNLTYNNSTNVLTISNSTFGDDVSINNNLIFGGQLLTGTTTSITSSSDYEIATTSAIISYISNETSDFISGITFNGDSGNEFLTELTLEGGLDISTSLSAGILTINFEGSYYNTIEGDTGTNTITLTGETLTFVGSTGITTEVSGNEVRISNDDSITYTTDIISNGNTGKTITIGTKSEHGSTLVDYYLTNSTGNQEGQFRVLLNGTSSGATRDFQGDIIDAFDSDDLLIDESGNISIKITNNSGSDVQMSYTFRNVDAH